MTAVDNVCNEKMSRLLGLAQKFNCFYLSGMYGHGETILHSNGLSVISYSVCVVFNVNIDLKYTQVFSCQLLHQILITTVSGLTSGECKPFIVEGYQVGLVRPDVMKMLTQYPEVGDCLIN